MDAHANYKAWLENEYFDDEELRKELESIRDNREEIEDRFYKELEFGTAGLRGIIGAGTNRMNKYIIRKVSQGVSDYINHKFKRDKNDISRDGTGALREIPRMIIAYDSRHKSRDFALEAAKVFAGNGIITYIFSELQPVPVLSFAIRHLGATGGVAITASHNPKNYNGYKVYGEDGAQLMPEESDKVLEFIKRIKDFYQVKMMQIDKAMEEGLVETIGKEIEDAYVDVVKSYCINIDLAREKGKEIRIVYTPLNGSGNKLVRRMLDETGFKNVMAVKEQEYPDPDFPTVKYPNPEDKSAFTLALELAKKEDADLIIATDPDSDRIGIMVRSKKGDYVFLTGNQAGCLMLDYVLGQKKEKEGALPENGFIVTTVVSTGLSKLIAEKYEIEVEEVFTGFKYIGEKIRMLDDPGYKKYLFGFEESYGYLAGTYARDKDAISASMLVAEMAAYYKSMDMTLLDALEKIYEKYGYVAEEVVSYTYSGKEGMEKMKAIMRGLRENKSMSIGDYDVISISDYLTGKKYFLETGKTEGLALSSSDVIRFELQHKLEAGKRGWFCVRPSGTEPKIKVYMEVYGDSLKEARKELDVLKRGILDNVLII
ncbi:MAG: phospho-sugar mutase [Clostridiaceae bacterium]|nr:phospho-sugar mutase [Clostridiaceae bacterium]